MPNWTRGGSNEPVNGILPAIRKRRAAIWRRETNAYQMKNALGVALKYQRIGRAPAARKVVAAISTAFTVACRCNPKSAPWNSEIINCSATTMPMKRIASTATETGREPILSQSATMAGAANQMHSATTAESAMKIADAADSVARISFAWPGSADSRAISRFTVSATPPSNDTTMASSVVLKPTMPYPSGPQCRQIERNEDDEDQRAPHAPGKIGDDRERHLAAGPREVLVIVTR